MNRFRNLLFVLIFSTIYLEAKIETLKNQYVYFSVSEDGTLGNGSDFPGIQYDSTGMSKFSNDGDYLQPGVPYEFFSVIVDDRLYAANNSEKDKKTFITKIKLVKPNQIIATSVIKNKIQLTHTYQLMPKRRFITITVNIKNISSDTMKDIYYARGLDPDSDNTGSKSSAATINFKGGKELTRKLSKYSESDLAFTQSAITKKPIGIYTNSKIKHNTSFESPWTMDPKKIIKGAFEKKGDHTINIAYKVDKLNSHESKKIVFNYIFGDDIAQAIDSVAKDFPMEGSMEGAPVNAIEVEYKNIKEYEVVAEGFFFIKKDNPKDTRKILDASLYAKNIPTGIKLVLIDEAFDNSNSESKKIRKFKYGEKNNYKWILYRNSNYREEKLSSIIVGATPKDKNNKLSKLEIKIAPKNRKITFELDTGSTNIPLDKLEESEPMPIKILADGEEITAEEYEKFELDADADGLYSDSFRRDNKTYIKLYPEYFMGIVPMLCLTKIGDVPIEVSVDEGFYPQDQGKDTLTVNIGDISWWDKCKIVIRNILILLFTIWYLFGLFRKDKFCHNQQIEIFRRLEDDDEKLVQGIKKLKKEVSLWQKLIPYRAESVKVNSFVLIAGSTCSMIFISKKTLGNIIEIESEQIDDDSKRDIKVYSNSTIITKTEIYELT